MWTKNTVSHLKPGWSDRDGGHVLIRLTRASSTMRMVVVRALQHKTTHFGSPNGANQCEMSGSSRRMSHTT